MATGDQRSSLPHVGWVFAFVVSLVVAYDIAFEMPKRIADNRACSEVLGNK